MGKSLSNKYGQIILDNAKKSATDAIKTASKTGKATDNLISDKITDKVTSASRISNKKISNNGTKKDVEITTHKKRYLSPKERQQIIDELRLVS